MKLSLIARRNKKIFESKINKKSLFLRQLPKKKHEAIKKVEEGKTELIIDKILGIGEFERDYAFFIYHNNKSDTPKNVILNPNVQSSLKNKINYFIQKENANKYDNYIYEEDNDNNIYNSRDNSDKKYNNNRYWKPKKLTISSSPSKNSKKYLNQRQNSFLSKVGNNIITSKTIMNSDNTGKKD